MDKKILVVGMLLGVFAGLTFSYLFSGPHLHSRDVLLKELELGIEHEMEEGNYGCCIDPPCDMCYLGHWLWDDGSCRCDEMKAQGEYDKVCPQCKKGIEEGRCQSDAPGVCDIAFEANS